MEPVQLVTLALVQGLTEFLPISSSAHLVLVPVIASWPDQGLAFDIAVHIGSLSAVVWYFRRDLTNMTTAWFESLRTRQLTPDARLAWFVIVATIPAGLVALAFGGVIETHLRSAAVIAVTTIVFGVLLWVADRRHGNHSGEHALTWRTVLFIGAMQALALIPGTSRSGITITAGLLVGLSREAAARFSFLMAVPIIALSGLKKGAELAGTAAPVDWTALATATLLAALSAYLCIKLFLRLIERVGMLPFVIYRLVLGCALLIWAF